MDKHLLDFEIEPLDMSDLQEQEQFSESDQDEISKPSEDGNEAAASANASARHRQQAQPSTEPSTDESSQQTSVSLGEDQAIFIKLRLPHGRMFTLTAYCIMNIRELKNLLSDEFQIPANIIDLWESNNNNNELPKLIENDDSDISSLGIKNGRLELHVTARDPDVELCVPPSKLIPAVDVITVTLEGMGGKSARQVVVELQSQVERRFLGGFRCRQTSVEYLHAETQTHPAYLNKEASNKILRSRTCQTNEIIDCIQQTSINQETQTIESVCQEDGRVITARSEVSSEDLNYLTSKVLTIQRVWRGWKARQSFGKAKSQFKIHSREVKSKSPPELLKQQQTTGYSPAVFEVLYQLVERWRKKCLDHAYASKTAGPTRADFQDILEMQVSLLGVIERERARLRQRLRREKEHRLLDKSCCPLTWKGYRGLTVSMETVQSQRAAELKKLYDLLGQEKVDPGQRKENLATVQAALKSQSNSRCSEILTLLNRELQLLEMGFGYKEVESLHKRIEKLFINFIKDPRSVKNISKETFYLCIQCKKMLPPTSFVIPLSEPAIKLCVSCHWLDNVSHKRVDHGPYQLMLRELRAEEMRRGCFKSLACVMEAGDVRYLVDQIWHGQSAISQTADLGRLRLGRWEQTQDWAPWNCVLLTRTELVEHAAVSQLHRVYGHSFIKNVRLKSLMAQLHFKSLYNFKFDL